MTLASLFMHLDTHSLQLVANNYDIMSTYHRAKDSECEGEEK